MRVRNGAEGVWSADPGRRWRLEEELRIGRADGEGPDVFGRIGSLVEDPLGRIWVVDPMAAEVRIFDRGGTHVRTIGRKGEGPGEFQRPAVMLNGPDGNIWIDDAMMRRWEVFDTAGVRVAGHPTHSNVGGGVRAFTADGHLLEVNSHPVPGAEMFTRRNNLSVRQLTAEGVLISADSLDMPRFPEGESVHFVATGGRQYTIRQRLPLAHHAMGLLAPTGDFWITDGGGVYAVRRQTAAGDTLLIIEREFEPVPASTRALEEAAEALVPPEGMNSSDNDRSRLPSVHPPFEDFFPASDGSLWVRRVVAPDSTALDVFDPEGRYLGEVELPADLADARIALITPDRIYAIAQDELEVESLRVMRVVKP